MRQTPTSCGRNCSQCTPQKCYFPCCCSFGLAFIAVLAPEWWLWRDALTSPGASLWCEWTETVLSFTAVSNSRLRFFWWRFSTNQADAELYSGKPIDTLTSDDPPVSEKKQSCVVMSLLEHNIDLALYEYIRSLVFSQQEFHVIKRYLRSVEFTHREVITHSLKKRIWRHRF